MDFSKKLGKTIVSIRKEKGISQEELAFNCGISRSYFGAIERGEKKISVAYLKKITDKLGITLSSFFIKMETWQD